MNNKLHKNICVASVIFASSAFKIISLMLVCSVALMAFDYDAEYLEINKTYQLHSDGSVTETYHNKIKLHTYRATQRMFGEDFIIYNPEFQELKITKSITTMVDGKVVETPPNGYNEVLPRDAVGDASLTGLREMVVTHTGLEQGCVVDFEYTIQSKPGYLPGLMGEEVFAKNEPVISYQLTVIITEKMELQFEVKNGDIPVTKKTDNSHKIYNWKMENIQPVLTEPNRINFEDNQPKLVFSTFKTWNELYDIFAESGNQKDNLSVEMQMKVKELTSKFSDEYKKIETLQNFVANYTGLADINPKYLGYKIKDIQTTYNENSGTSLDKAVLLSSMLNHIGLKSYPAFVSKSTVFCDSIASMEQFNDVVINVRCNGETLLLSPTGSIENSPEGTGKFLFRMDKKLKKIQPLKSYTEKANYQTMTMNLTLCKDLKLSGNGTFNFGGIFNQYNNLRDNDKAGMVISGSIGKLSSENETITKLEMDCSSINAELTSEVLEDKNGYIYLTLPEFSHGFNNTHIVTALPERKTALDLQNCQSEEVNIQIKLPENVEAISTKVKEYAKSDVGYVRLKFYTEDNMLYIKKSLVLKANKVDPEEYAEFHKMIKLWENEKFGQVVLKVSE